MSYAFLQNIIRSPKPLDPEWTWHAITRDMPRGTDWIRTNWPLKPLRPLVIRAKMKQDHVLGISAHYDVSNDFYKLFLDKRYMFYSCADFHRPDDTIEEAQQHKADFILRLIDPKPGQKILELGCGWGSMLRRIDEAHGRQGKPVRPHALARAGGLQRRAQRLQSRLRQLHHPRVSRRGVRRDLLDRRLGACAAERDPAAAGEALPRAQARRPARAALHLRVNDDLHRHRWPARRSTSRGRWASSYRFHAKAHEDAGFRTTHRSMHDYRPTLRAWFDNLVATQRGSAASSCRRADYNRYLTFFPASWRYFNDNYGVVIRWVLEKPAIRAPGFAGDAYSGCHGHCSEWPCLDPGASMPTPGRGHGAQKTWVHRRRRYHWMRRKSPPAEPAAFIHGKFAYFTATSL